MRSPGQPRSSQKQLVAAPLTGWGGLLSSQVSRVLLRNILGGSPLVEHPVPCSNNPEVSPAWKLRAGAARRPASDAEGVSCRGDVHQFKH